MQDLKTQIAQIESPIDMIEYVWETSTKNGSAQMYLIGMIDALRYAKAITLEEYNQMYSKYVYGGTK